MERRGACVPHCCTLIQYRIGPAFATTALRRRSKHLVFNTKSAVPQLALFCMDLLQQHVYQSNGAPKEGVQPCKRDGAPQQAREQRQKLSHLLSQSADMSGGRLGHSRVLLANCRHKRPCINVQHGR